MRLFGTDGVRGLAGGPVLTPELTVAVCRAAVRVMGGRTVAVGRDTRPSGPLLESAAAAGFAAAGADVLLLGVVPTPLVAQVVASGEADLGLVVSASHNPMADNGLKLFGPWGHKLPDAVEDAIEAALGAVEGSPVGLGIGSISPADRTEGYLASLAGPDLDGLTVVVDCAQGAASVLAPEAYRRAGARVIALHADGEGRLINDACGATHPASLAAAVLEHGADLGVAHDGDADRCIVVDATGRVLNGDQVLGLLAVHLDVPVLVATVMSNLGLHHAMAARDIEVLTTAVGDRYVLEAMLEGGHRLGGEQSGHVVLLDRATTGDGLLTALQVMAAVRQSGSSLAELADVVELLPQVLVNVPALRSRAVDPRVLEAVAVEEVALAGSGRVLLRPSGTEELVRVMVEAPSQQLADEIARRLATVVTG